MIKPGLAGSGTIARIRSQKPLIHCITNSVTAGDVANMILAVGALPVMADEICEVSEITGQSQALVLNLGTLKVAALEAMLVAGRTAADRGIPIVLDPVGIGASAFRWQAAVRVIEEIPCSVIRGNSSEIRVLTGQQAFARGVDAGQNAQLTAANRDELIRGIKALSCETGAAIIMTGEQDLVCDQEQVAFVRNGSQMMRQITGAGCMMNGIIAACLAAGSSAERFWQAVYAVAATGICGEIAAAKTMRLEEGTGSFRTYFLDAMSLLTDERVGEGANIEI